MQDIPILKKPDPNRTAIIAFKDAGEGKVTLVLLYDPPLRDEDEVTPAQALGGHCFGFCKNLVDNMSKQDMEAGQLPTVEAAQAAFDQCALQAHQRTQQGMRMTQTPQERFKVPTIVPGEVGDLARIDKEHKK